MRKIPTLFERDPERRAFVTREVDPAAAWVLTEPGVRATRKFDGTCTEFDGVAWWARREVKPGKAVPPDYRAVETDATTGKTMGWEPVGQSAFAKAFASVEDVPTTPGTYELVGPKVNGNPEGCERHELVPHGAWVLDDVPSDFDGLAAWLAAHEFEGVVWHHPDGRMAKIKRRDIDLSAAERSVG